MSPFVFRVVPSGYAAAFKKFEHQELNAPVRPVGTEFARGRAVLRPDPAVAGRRRGRASYEILLALNHTISGRMNFENFSKKGPAL